MLNNFLNFNSRERAANSSNFKFRTYFIFFRNCRFASKYRRNLTFARGDRVSKLVVGNFFPGTGDYVGREFSPV
ncbi:hypothetical protein BES34_003195 [Leptospira inadai serovar Lyme]|uniref:Uncharacterized protein n=1 Tax=Leptospira inadai serovar Lyme TaxID=293084 RepID=A0ABX4YMT3_9LEPT|nr:hypothetical protein BES34_003195 [Leptospira inadai serovar Lyme]